MPDDNDDPSEEKGISEEAAEIMETHDLDEESAERVLEIMDELGLDEDDALELQEAE